MKLKERADKVTMMFLCNVYADKDGVLCLPADFSPYLLGVLREIRNEALEEAASLCAGVWPEDEKDPYFGDHSMEGWENAQKAIEKEIRALKESSK